MQGNDFALQNRIPANPAEPGYTIAVLRTALPFRLLNRFADALRGDFPVGKIVPFSLRLASLTFLPKTFMMNRSVRYGANSK